MTQSTDLKTLQEILLELSNSKQHGLYMTIKRAGEHLVKQGDFSFDTKLSAEELERLRQAIYDVSDFSRKNASVDPIAMLLEAMASETGSGTEEALQFIEQLQKQLHEQTQ